MEEEASSDVEGFYLLTSNEFLNVTKTMKAFSNTILGCDPDDKSHNSNNFKLNDKKKKMFEVNRMNVLNSWKIEITLTRVDVSDECEENVNFIENMRHKVRTTNYLVG